MRMRTLILMMGERESMRRMANIYIGILLRAKYTEWKCRKIGQSKAGSWLQYLHEATREHPRRSQTLYSSRPILLMMLAQYFDFLRQPQSTYRISMYLVVFRPPIRELHTQCDVVQKPVVMGGGGGGEGQNKRVDFC